MLLPVFGDAVGGGAPGVVSRRGGRRVCGVRGVQSVVPAVLGGSGEGVRAWDEEA